ncbi:MAG: hypothetical protein LBN20_02980 [Endomicrobium sp.]|jgi:hypothetical protein|nr:hypothetical protein [Endomicrobium sp.]
MNGYEEIRDNDKIIAIVIRANYQQDGTKFFTPDTDSLQLAYMHHPAGKIVQSHIHNKVMREIVFTKEIIFMKRGKYRADFYNDEQKLICSRILCAGDIVILISGGHGFEALEEVEMFVVKQGPYAGINDKTHFNGKERMK